MKIDKATIVVFVIVLFVAGALLYWKNAGTVIQNNIATEEEAKWIGNHSVIYSQTGCIHCKEQEDLFGTNVKYLNIIDCLQGDNLQKCILANITGTPTWIINGKQYVGVQSIAKLKELTGYPA